MENASKSLIMAAEILLGVMIISIGVYLFNTLGSYSSETTSQIEDAQIAQFNDQFLKYYGTSGGETIKCTIHTIVGLANLAQRINTENGFTEIETISDNSYYIQIDLKVGATTIKNIEALTQDELINLIKENDVMTDDEGSASTKLFICDEEPGIGKNTRRVNYMKFVEI